MLLRWMQGPRSTHPIGDGARRVRLPDLGRARTFDEEQVATGDAAKVTDQPELHIRATEASELILVDVPMEFEPVGVWRGRI